MAISTLLYGDAGTGKTTLALSGPAPRLLIDAELRSAHAHRIENGKIIKADVVKWDIQNEAEIPESKDTIVATISKAEDLTFVNNYLFHNSQPFKTIILDSLTEIQFKLKEEIQGDGAFQIAQWGILLQTMQAALRRLKDLTLKGVEALIFTALAEPAFNGNKTQPMLQGGIVKSLPALVDMVGYTKLKMDADKFSQSVLIGPHDDFITKISVPSIREKYGAVLNNPSIQELISLAEILPGELNQKGDSE